MKKTYFAWANAQRTAWIEMTGEEFYQFINREENKDRLFIPADDEFEECENSYIYMEVTIEDYREWDRKRKKREREAEKKPIEIIPLEMVIGFDRNGHEFTLADTLSESCERSEYLEELLELLPIAIQELSQEDQQIIKLAFFGKKGMKETEMGALLGMPQSTFNYHKKKILKNLHEKLVGKIFLSK